MDVLDQANLNLDQVLKLADDYRKDFFKTPRGANSWRNTTPLDGMMTNLHNNKMAESFHFQSCLKCNANEYWPENFKPEEKMNEVEKAMWEIVKKNKPQPVKLKLKSVDGGYFFICKDCECAQ